MQSTEFFGRIWLPVYFFGQLAAFIVVLAVDPSGFDRCEAVPSFATRTGQIAVGTLAVVGCASLALWRLRRSLLVVALLLTTFGAAAWASLLIDRQSC